MTKTRIILLIFWLSLPFCASGEGFEYQPYLQNFVQRAYGIGFLNIGDGIDFYHGHLLYVRRDGRAVPHAILYHTQEMAFDGKMDYVNRDARNWVQFVQSPEVVVNANKFKKEEKHRNENWAFFERAFSLDSGMIDLRLEIVKDHQFNFMRVSCESKDFAVLLPSGEKVCLKMMKDTCWIPHLHEVERAGCQK